MGPLTSILIPLYNESCHVGACLASIPYIEGWPLEIVVVDDQSTDDTLDVAAAAVAKMPPGIAVRVLRNPVKGKAAAFDLAFAEAGGAPFSLLGSDDLLLAEALPGRIAAVCGPGPALAVSRYRSFSEDLAQDGNLFSRPGLEGQMAGGAINFNRAYVNLCFPIPVEPPNEDTWMRAVTILFDVPLQFLPIVGLLYRLHEGNSTGPRRGFSGTDMVLRQRNAVFGLAFDRFPHGGTPTTRTRLARAESLRHSRNWLGIAFMQGLSRVDRLVMMATYTPWLYRIKRWMVKG